MSSRAGLKQIGFVDAGTLASTKTDPLAMGFRKGAKLEMSEFKQIADYRGRKLRNMKNFHFEGESLQPSMRLISKMHEWINQGADVQILTNAPIGGNKDVFQFATAGYRFGLDLELMISEEMRSLKVLGDVAMEFGTAKALIDTADSAAEVDLGFTDKEGADLTLIRAPYYLAFEYPKATSLITSKGEIVKRSLSMKTKTGKKTIYNQSIVDYYSFLLTLQVREAAVTNIIANLAKAMSDTLYWKEQNQSSSFFDAFDFAANALTLTNKETIDDEERIVELTFEGDVPVDEVEFTFGATYGGDIGDTTGLKGGTMSIG